MKSDILIEVDCESVSSLLRTKQPFLLLDCREASEYASAKIAGAVFMPMNEIPQRLDELESYRDLPLIVHCHHGGRSLRVAQFLRQQGYSQAQSMAGGIDAWSLRIDPTVPRY